MNNQKLFNCSLTVIIPHYVSYLLLPCLPFAQKRFMHKLNTPKLYFEKFTKSKISALFPTCSLKRHYNHYTPLLITSTKKETIFPKTPEIFYMEPTITKIHNVSGIWQTTKEWDQDLSNKTILAKMLVKFAIDMFDTGKIISKECIARKIKYFLQPSKNLDIPYYYPLAQHLSTNLLPYYKTDSTILKEITQGCIDYKAYDSENIAIQTVIEAYVLNTVIAPFLKNNNGLLATAQNAENSLGDHTQYAQLAYLLTKQPHPDLRITLPTKILFFDVKLKSSPESSTALNKGHISLIQNTREKNMDYLNKRYISDLNGTNIQKVQNEDTKQFKRINDYYKEKLNKILKNKTLNIREKYDRINKIKEELNLDPAITMIVASMLGNLPYDVFFDTVYDNELKTYDYSIIEKNIALNVLFPKGSQHVNVTEWKYLLAHVIYNLPQPIFHRVIDNYKKFREIEYDI